VESPDATIDRLAFGTLSRQGIAVVRQSAILSIDIRNTFHRADDRFRKQSNVIRIRISSPALIDVDGAFIKTLVVAGESPLGIFAVLTLDAIDRLDVLEVVLHGHLDDREAIAAVGEIHVLLGCVGTTTRGATGVRDEVSEPHPETVAD